MENSLRILSLLPAATEIIYLLGLEKYLVGVSHECDFPKQAKLLPKVTSSPISNDLSSKEINDQVARFKHKGSGVFHIDEKLLAKLKPNLILTQELCDVCAISWTEVKKAAKVLDGEVKIVSLEPESVEDVLENILLVASITQQNLKAEKVVNEFKKRVQSLERKLPKQKPKVLMIEWLEPLMIAGHWVPEMIDKAGGIGVITTIGQKSYPISIEEAIESNPEVIIYAPCGFDIKRTLREKPIIDELVSKLGNNKKYYLLDANSYLTRPGPRIVDGIEILSEILHPEIFPRKYSEKNWANL